MKKFEQLLAITASALIIVSCQDANNQSDVTEDTLANEQSAADTTPKSNTQYVDLKTGQPVDLYYNPKKKRTYSESTNEPVDLYVNVATGDTIYGQGRYVVNGYIVKTEDGTYKLDNKKIKIDGDEIKIKEGNKKFKMEDGEMKIKDGDVKVKSDEDESKLKTEDMKLKKEAGEDTKMKKD
ncbi:hypothetical protein [Longitalea arenae]|uniref:hypothetical protein n=1 Tax=Longitalea arenae TaxID=2812558 RepID=UPI001967F1F7|nr:hypothetical protein [Longitalea arenae]